MKYIHFPKYKIQIKTKCILYGIQNILIGNYSGPLNTAYKIHILTPGTVHLKSAMTQTLIH